VDQLLLLIIGIAGAVAGPVGGVISLVSFPALLAMGYDPLTANVTNTVAVVSVATVSSSWAYRKQIEVSRPFAAALLVSAGLGGLGGGLLLVVLGERFFESAVPALLVTGAALILLQPFIVRRLSIQSEHGSRRKAVVIGTGIVSIYAGYFGAGAGVLIFALFATMMAGGVQRANALKSFVSIAGNATAAMYFAFVGVVAWEAVAPLAIGSVIGGQIGVRIARRLLRALQNACGHPAKGALNRAFFHEFALLLLTLGWQRFGMPAGPVSVRRLALSGEVEFVSHQDMAAGAATLKG
jgi:uncharacterized protein